MLFFSPVYTQISTVRQWNSCLAQGYLNSSHWGRWEVYSFTLFTYFFPFSPGIHFCNLSSPATLLCTVCLCACAELCMCVFIPLCVCTRHRDGAAGVFSCRLIMASLQCSAFHARIINVCLLMLSGYEGYTGISLCIDLHFNVWRLGLFLSVEKYYTV